MTPKKRIKDLKKQLRKDGTNPSLRRQLADAYLQDGQTKEAVEVYLGVAFDLYRDENLDDAASVCQTILEHVPEQKETVDLLKVVNLAQRSKRAASEVDAQVARGDWVPSLKSPAGERPVTATGNESNDSARPDASKDGKVRKPVAKSKATRNRKARAGHATEADAARSEERGPSTGVTLASTSASVDAPIDAEDSESLVLLTPTPLPAPMAPHEADDEDSVVEDEIERYRLPIASDPSGPIPQISLPDNLEPVFDDLLPDAEFDDDTHEVRTSLTNKPTDRLPTQPRSPEVVSFLDEDPTQLTVLSEEERAIISGADEDERERLSTEEVPIQEDPEDADAGDTMTMRQKTTPRGPTQNASPVDAPLPSWADDLDPYDDDDLGPTGEHPIRASQSGIPQGIDHDSTVRISMPDVSPFLEEPLIGSNPFIDLPERPDGLPLVIHDDMELGDGLGDSLADIFSDGFPDASYGDRVTTQRKLSHGRDPLEAFATLPDEALKELASRMTMRHYAADQYVVRQEERARCCYSLVSGHVSLLRYDPMDPDGDYQELIRLEPGQLFGESCLLPVRYSRGSVLALSDCDLYEIPRRLLRELGAVHEGVDEALDAIYRERSLDGLFATHPFLRGLKPHRQQEVRQHFETVHYSSGSLLFEEGNEHGGLALVQVGAAEVTKRLSRSRSTLLTTIEEGSYISDMSPLAGSTVRATVRAASPLELAVLPAEKFREVIDEAPELWETICAERGRGVLERNYLLTGPGIMI